MKNRRSKLVIILAVAICAAGLLGGVSWFNSGLVSAVDPPPGEANQGEGEDAHGGKCIKSGNTNVTSYVDECYGATWRYYTDLDGSGMFSAPGTKSGHVESKTGGPCKFTRDIKNSKGDVVIKAGTVFEGYYRLGLEYYNPKIYYSSDPRNAAGASLGKQAGISRNGRLCSINQVAGCLPFNTVPGSFSLEHTLVMYQYALKFRMIGSMQGDNWNGDLGWFCYDSRWAHIDSNGIYHDSTQTDIPTTPPPPSKDGSGEFNPVSHVVIDRQNVDVVDYHEHTDGKDNDSVIVKLSTDDATFTGKFYHELYYTKTGGSGNFDDVTTAWYITETVDGVTTRGADNPVASGLIRTSGGSTGLAGKTDTYSKTVNLDRNGKATTVCHEIHYRSKYFTFTLDIGQNQAEGSGMGASKACYEITRPTHPDGNSKSTTTAPRADGTNDGTIMYTGEDAEIGWNVWADTVPTRRLARYREIVYDVYATQNYYSGITSGNLTTIKRITQDPCAWYNRKSTNEDCAVIKEVDLNSKSLSSSSQKKVNEAAKIVVPNRVGYKYCNSFGWQYEYWYSVTKNGVDNWREETRLPRYWTTYDATCRAISKKPTVTVWNGSMLSNNGVSTTLSSRFNDARYFDGSKWHIIGRRVEGSSEDALYGSWVEYLGVIGKKDDGFGSGSAFAIGSTSLSLYPYNSQLTIANNKTEAIGNSGVSANPTLRTRLDTFLKNRAISSGNAYEVSDKKYVSSILGKTTIGDTRIIYIKRQDGSDKGGNLVIDQNIVLNTGGYNNIYHVPQVVIFVDGNVEVTSEVTQIDAWIIANGNLDTCSDFTPGGYDANKILTKGSDADAINREGGVCNKQLAFNGPVMAGSLTLHRSYGSDPTIRRDGAYSGSKIYQNLRECADNESTAQCSKRYSAGEIFNYRADSYLWAYAQAGRYDSSYTESYSRELAPRY